MHRRIVAIVLVFLLLGMQQEAQWHALGHVGDALQQPHEQGLRLPQADDVCAICALFAGGSTAATSSTAALPEPAAYHAGPRHAVSSRTAAAPSFYLSRAPPVLL
jgi:hypothetical protein